MNHTPTPWRVESRAPNFVSLVDTEGVPLTDHWIADYIGAKILRAVNNHEALLAACKAFDGIGDHCDLAQGLPLKKLFQTQFDQLKAAIAAAEKV